MLVRPHSDPLLASVHSPQLPRKSAVSTSSYPHFGKLSLDHGSIFPRRLQPIHPSPITSDWLRVQTQLLTRWDCGAVCSKAPPGIRVKPDCNSDLLLLSSFLSLFLPSLPFFGEPCPNITWRWIPIWQKHKGPGEIGPLLHLAWAGVIFQALQLPVSPSPLEAMYTHISHSDFMSAYLEITGKCRHKSPKVGYWQAQSISQ